MEPRNLGRDKIIENERAGEALTLDGRGEGRGRQRRSILMTTTPGTELIELETGVFARLHEGLTNAGIIVGNDGVLVIDSLRVPSFARDLIRRCQAHHRQADSIPG